MAQDGSRRPTPRQKTPVSPGSRAARPTARQRAPKAARAPKVKAPKAKSPRPAKAAKVKIPKTPRPAPRASAAPRSGSARPSFLDRAQQRAQAPSGTPHPTTGRERRERYQRAQLVRVVAIALGAVAVAALVAVVSLFALRDSSVFSIDSVEVEPTAHVSEQDIQNLVQVPLGSTLLNVDTASIEQTLRRDPWVASVSFERVFPHTLKITIHEQAIDALVVMSSGSIAWYLGDAGVWIQPTSIEAAEGQSVNDAALDKALAEGCLLVTDVPATVSPVAGSEATDDALKAVEQFREGFSDDFASQVVCYSAPSADSVSCTLENGVTVLLGSATNISTKEGIVRGYLNDHAPGSVLYINVRVVSNPSLRPVESDNVEAGTGVVASSSGSGSGSAGDGDAGSGADAGTGTGDGADAGAADDGSADDGSQGADGADEADASGADAGDDAGAETPSE